MLVTSIIEVVGPVLSMCISRTLDDRLSMANLHWCSERTFWQISSGRHVILSSCSMEGILFCVCLVVNRKKQWR